MSFRRWVHNSIKTKSVPTLTELTSWSMFIANVTTERSKHFIYKIGSNTIDLEVPTREMVVGGQRASWGSDDCERGVTSSQQTPDRVSRGQKGEEAVYSY